MKDCEATGTTYSSATGALVTTSDSSSLKVLSGASRRLAVVLSLSPLLIFLTLLRAFMLDVRMEFQTVSKSRYLRKAVGAIFQVVNEGNSHSEVCLRLRPPAPRPCQWMRDTTARLSAGVLGFLAPCVTV